MRQYFTVLLSFSFILLIKHSLSSCESITSTKPPRHGLLGLIPPPVEKKIRQQLNCCRIHSHRGKRMYAPQGYLCFAPDLGAGFDTSGRPLLYSTTRRHALGTSGGLCLRNKKRLHFWSLSLSGRGFRQLSADRFPHVQKRSTPMKNEVAFARIEVIRKRPFGPRKT